MMLPKPAGLRAEYAAQFQDRSVVAAYHLRPPYPDEVFDILAGLIGEVRRPGVPGLHSSSAVLDVGCGTGEIARGLVDCVDRVDAVDFSREMIARGRSLPKGNHPNLNWIHGRAEEAPLQPPYTLVTAGSSLDWMEWEIVLPRFREVLVRDGYLAIIGQMGSLGPWSDDLIQLVTQYSTNREYQPYDLVEELELRGLFHKRGEKETAPLHFVQSLDDYVESFHSRNGFSRDRMIDTAAAAFDRALKALLSPFSRDGRIALQIVGRVVWGIPSG